MTIAQRSHKTASSTWEKCVIVMSLGSICETVVHTTHSRLLLADDVFVFCF